MYESFSSGVRHCLWPMIAAFHLSGILCRFNQKRRSLQP
ncbi:hypothetical protein SynBIOSE41_02735 [Synechococcus sp. BIOS-E4-1]|nr:hypothetical protein SynBIOSE41_02735 [Synechococcus sp. BIOS-E4-1]